tara:strand:- start:351 stop:497 length:147 start_codon:yes stop_codon:yes gene_type:complete
MLGTSCILAPKTEFEGTFPVANLLLSVIHRSFGIHIIYEIFDAFSLIV